MGQGWHPSRAAPRWGRMSLPCLCSPCSPCSPPSPLGHTHGTPTGLGAVPGRDTEPVDGDEDLGEAGSSPKSRRLLPVVATHTHAHTPGSSPPRTTARSQAHAAPLPHGDRQQACVYTCVHTRVRGQGGRRGRRARTCPRGAAVTSPNLSALPAGAEFHPLDPEKEGQSLLRATRWGG